MVEADEFIKLLLTHALEVRNPQHLVVEVMTHILAAVDDISQLQTQNAEELPEDLIGAHLVNENQIR